MMETTRAHAVEDAAAAPVAPPDALRWCSCKASARGFDQHMAWCPAEADAMSGASKMSLFQHGFFVLASGQQASWKIECDALTDKDWECIAKLIARRYSFSEVHGVPSGGNKLAELLQREVVGHPVPQDFNSLIVDDVYTTGGSIRAMRDQLILRPNGGGKHYLGCVLFARARINPADGWVRPLFQYEG